MSRSPADHHTANQKLTCPGSKTTSFSFQQRTWQCSPVGISSLTGLSFKTKTYAWIKDDYLFISYMYLFSPSQLYLFSFSIQEQDGGSYFCRASNRHLQIFLTSKKATLTVLGVVLMQTPYQCEDCLMKMCVCLSLSLSLSSHSPTFSETVAHSVDRSCGSPGNAGVWGVRSSFALHQLDEKRPLQTNWRQDSTGVSYVGAYNKTV